MIGPSLMCKKSEMLAGVLYMLYTFTYFGVHSFQTWYLPTPPS